MRKITLLFFINILFYVSGQELTVLDSQTELFENIHLHLNKTTFLRGERLWFKAYVQDQKRKLSSVSTTNLNVGIYDADGKEIVRSLLYVENGMAQGDFAIDSTFINNEYIVLAWTNYMRNFKELPPFRQQIKILNDDFEDDSGDIKAKISIYPEGGHLIAGAYNNIGVSVDNGFGQGLEVGSLELVDEEGKILRKNIKTNTFGIGKVGFMVEADKNYYLRQEEPSLPITRHKLPDAISGQLGMSIDNNGNEKVLVRLLANSKTFSARDGDMITLVVYQDDFVLFNNFKINKRESVISINRSEMPHGVISAVLFDEGLKPISYRMFFNHLDEEIKLNNIEIDYCLSESSNSLQVDFILPKGIDKEVTISLSALSAQNIAYNPDNSIISAFKLKPYAKKSFKDFYFFDKPDRKKRFELDNRLLIEGWGKFDWNSRKLKETKKIFEMEHGISVRGKVIDADLNVENQISLIAELSRAMNFEELDKNKSFQTNMLLYNGDSLGVSLISKKGKLRKPKIELQLEKKLSSALDDNDWLVNQTMKRQVSITKEIPINVPLNIDERIIELDEVILLEDKPRNNKFQLSPTAEGRIIDDIDIKRTPSASSYFVKLGFLLGGDSGETKIFVRDRPGLREVPILIDGMKALPGEIIGMPLSRVKFLSYSKSRTNPFISITLNSNYVAPENRNKFVKFVIEEGYSLPQEYFTPNYSYNDSEVFKYYGALDWKPYIRVNDELPISISIPTYNQKSMMLIFEGMGEEGNLISRSEKIDLSSRE